MPAINVLSRNLRRLCVASALLMCSVAAQATTISGNWIGNWSGSGITANFDMFVGAENSLGQFNGSFNWLCTSGLSCSGTENFAGTQTGNSVAFASTSFINPVNLGASSYTGMLSTDGLTLSGTDSSAGRWSAHKALNVPEPNTLALMLITLGGMFLASRKQSLFGSKKA